MNVLMIGDVVGRPARRALKRCLPGFREANGVDLCVANGENAAGGSGITAKLANELFASGIDVITTGDHVWKKREIIPRLDADERILRPGNYSARAAGRGCAVYEVADRRVAVVSLLGRMFMKPVDCPFACADVLIPKLREETPIILVDFHAEATSEKIAMGWYLDGKVSAVVGTHTHVQTADERVLPKGTAYISDLGMTGPHDSILGRSTEKVLQALVTQMPERFYVAKGDVRICGALISIDDQSGRARDIRRIVLLEDECPDVDADDAPGEADGP